MMACDLKKSVLRIRKKKRKKRKKKRKKKMASTTRCMDYYCQTPHNIKDMLTSRPNTTMNMSRGAKTKKHLKLKFPNT